ncbi:MAG: long-chain fatty acid--CoA ligase, partial [Alphaproteobacteria bacterium]|nr:long-chain fatty acid--CoA ligase [Alphaproteobacteria bacterium]
MNTVLTLHDPGTARRYYDAGLWRPDTFYSLMSDHAKHRPDGYALRDSGRRLTWWQIKDWTDAMAAALHDAGVVKGQRVSLWLPNRVEGVVTLLACARNGYVCNPSLHLNYTGEDISDLLARIRASALVVEADYGAATADTLDAIADMPGMKRVFRLPSGRETGSDFPAIMSYPENKPDADASPDKPCYLAFTSGTTGTPKGVLHSDNTLLANARDMVRDWGHGKDTILLSLSPISHHIAWVGVAQMLLAGGELVLNDPPAGMKPLDWIVETGATYVMGVPTHGMDILADQR